ncbi:MAG: site-2 protease family protein [Acidobacteria bacterium]|nr:site-2 protease family protein [Acidobacteriota bacterium]
MNFDSLFTVPIGDLILYFVAFIFSLSVHESAHAITSYWFGDDTAQLQGRISLNPMVHIDPIGTLAIPLLGFITVASGLPPLIGWAKPVDVNPLRWRNKDLANITVSAAGPISNLILALICFTVLKVMMLSGTVVPGFGQGGRFNLVTPLIEQSSSLLMPICTFLSVMLLLNVSLAVFNLIPIPPLDGSHVLETLLPESFRPLYDQIKPYSFFILIGLLWLGVLSYVFNPVMIFVIKTLYGIW